MTTKQASLILVLGLCCAALFAPAPGNAAETVTLRIAGGSAPMENVFKRIKPHFEKKTGILLDLVESGPLDAYVQLNANEVDAASAGLMYGEWAKKIDQKVVDQLEEGRNRLQIRFVGTDFVTLYSHPGVDVHQLSAPQVRKIFTGAATNWREFGGGDKPIIVILGRKVAGLMTEFHKRVLNGADFAPKAVYVDTAREMKEKVRATPGAVSIGTLAQVQDDTINPIAYPAPERYIHMIWKGASPKKEALDTLHKYLMTPDAQQYTLSEYPRSDTQKPKKRK